MINTYLIAAVIIFLALGLMWKKDNFSNFFIKLILIIMFIIGLIILLEFNGFLIKIT